MRPCALILSLLMLTGCNGVKQPTNYAQLGLVQVSGQIMVDGEPLSGGSVIFEAEDKTFSASETDSSGRYQLRFNSEQMGIPPGTKTVRISGRGLPSENDEGAEPDTKPKTKDSVPACYHKSSEIVVTVDDGHTSFDFDLLSDCSTRSAK